MSKSILLVGFIFLMSLNITTAQNPKIYITSLKRNDNSVEFNYIKNVSGNYFIEFDIEKAVNVLDIAPLKRSYNLNLKEDSGTLFTLYPIDKNKEILCSYSYSYKRGLVKPQIDSTIVYLLPFKENKEISLSESTRFNVAPEIWKNYVVYSKIKDTIYGMRKGIITEIKKIPVPNSENIVFRTEIIVDHADGTNASYFGLDDKSLFVKLNDHIYPGTPLGFLDDVLNSYEDHTFKFNVYYFSNEVVENLEGKQIKIVEKSVFPKFLTATGIQRLQGNIDYTVKYNDTVVSQEMTTEEKQKLKIVF